jgi:hypothetical protein
VRQTSGRELGATGFALRVVRPLKDGGRVVGFVELGEDVPTLLRRIKQFTGHEYGMLLSKDRLDRAAWQSVAGEHGSWDDRPDLVAVETTTGDGALLEGISRLADLPEWPTVLERTRTGRRTLIRGIFPLRDGAGAKIGGVVVLWDMTRLSPGASEILGSVGGPVALVGGGAALGVALLAGAARQRRGVRGVRSTSDE